MSGEHADAVLRIYQAGIDTGHATFQDRAPDWAAWDENHLPECRLSAVDDSHGLLGWAALAPVSKRPVYRGVCEVSLYIDPVRSGGGLGRALLGALVSASEQAGIWTLHSSIFPENEASVAVHLGCGFRTMGRREKIALMTYGPMAGQWRDTVIMERRSRVVHYE